MGSWKWHGGPRRGFGQERSKPFSHVSEQKGRDGRERRDGQEPTARQERRKRGLRLASGQSGGSRALCLVSEQKGRRRAHRLVSGRDFYEPIQQQVGEA